MSIAYTTGGNPPPDILLNDTQKQALDRLCRNRYRRGRNRWETPGDQDISFDVAALLKQKNLAVIRHGSGRDRIEATGLGLEIRQMIRRKRGERRLKQRERSNAE
ncbi:hypothetical protein GTW51_10180 [Aurantimonas aggregata]|uniref:Uncharacterized protein n=1 Tax=Aurantimonas aggregata TaxID=2047720 RepID=A0A6L9MGY7_9HYPH|nr:hypothetical protein [Aurantimonas aggregata]NDV87069.1 hypothetical protein [Aurantimonas aggregata]